MTLPPVTQRRIDIAKKFGLSNVDTIARACRDAGVPFYVACALFEKESGGRNVYGNDKGGALSGFPGAVNYGSYAVFKWLVFEKGQTSNGVGPAQITYKGFFTDMEKQKLKPYVVYDNMLYGLKLLNSHYLAGGKSWRVAGAKYNGADTYGADLDKKIREWGKRLEIPGF